MKTWVTLAVLLCCLAVASAFLFKKRGKCADNFPRDKCKEYVEQDTCHLLEARQNCGVTCEACGEACIDWHSKCSQKDIMEELCPNESGAFMICARSCNLCIDQ